MPKTFDVTAQLIAFEEGRLEETERIELFQYLVDSGLAWQLQGFYGRAAQCLIEDGLINAPTGSTR